METRKIKLTKTTAERWLNGNNEELKQLALSTFPELGKKVLPKNWEELEKVSGYYACSFSSINKLNNNLIKDDENKNTFATQQQAEASISTAMYSQLLNAYKDVSIVEFIEIAKEYEEKVRPLLELFFFENAKSAFYLGLLMQLVKVYNDGWEADWTNNNQDKYVLLFDAERIIKGTNGNVRRLLALKDQETAQSFLEKYRELIEIAKPLL